MQYKLSHTAIHCEDDDKLDGLTSAERLEAMSHWIWARVARHEIATLQEFGCCSLRKRPVIPDRREDVGSSTMAIWI
jgi:hypothetical protein